MIALLAFLVLLVVLVSFGERLSRLLELRPGPLLERLALAWVLSAGVVTLIVFGMAALHGITRWSALVLVGLMGLASLGAARDLFRELGGTFRRELLLRPGGLDRLLLALLGLFLAGGLVMALAPPTGMDTGVYHFTIPKVILKNHGLVSRDDLWIHKSGGFYMLYVLGMALGGEISAKLLAFATALAGAGLCAGVADRLRPGTGRVAMFILLSTPLSAGYLGYEYLELPVLTYIFAALLAILRGAESRTWTVLACGFTGLVLSAKPSAFAAAVLVPAALGMLLARERGRGVAAALGSLLLFAATAGFWYAWNYLSTGSLIYRYPGLKMEGGGAAEGSRWLGLAQQLRFLLTCGVYWTDSAGPLIPAGVVGFLVFHGTRASRLPILLGAASIGGFIAFLLVAAPDYLFSGMGARYLAPCLVGFGTPVAAQFVGWVRERPGPLRVVVLLALVLPAVPLLVLKAGKAAVAAPAAFGLESRSAYLGKKIETFAACEQLNQLPDPGVKVLFAAARPYYLDRPFIWVPYAGSSSFFRDVNTWDDFIRRLRERGITHVLYEPGGFRCAPFIEAHDFGPPTFRELGRWPWKYDRSVRLFEVQPQ